VGDFSADFAAIGVVAALKRRDIPQPPGVCCDCGKSVAAMGGNGSD